MRVFRGILFFVFRVFYIRTRRARQRKRGSGQQKNSFVVSVLFYTLALLIRGVDSLGFELEYIVNKYWEDPKESWLLQRKRKLTRCVMVRWIRLICCRYMLTDTDIAIAVE